MEAARKALGDVIRTKKMIYDVMISESSTRDIRNVSFYMTSNPSFMLSDNMSGDDNSQDDDFGD